MFLLYETASGYALFETNQYESIGRNLEEVQQDILDLGKFGKSMNLKSFIPFKTAAHALENINAISEGVLHPFLKDFLELNMPKSSKKSSVQLGVTDKALAGSIKQELGYDCVCDDMVNEITRGLRFHCEKLLRQLSPSDMVRAQLGLSHSYSRSKVRYNVNRSDNMIIQAIALCDQLDKDINLFSMRIREWFSWHFPELAKLVPDNHLYARICVFIRNRNSLNAEKVEALSEITQDTELAHRIIEVAKTSMGTDISEIDMLNIDHFASRLVSLVNYRKELGLYLSQKMNVVAPNLASLIGDAVAARLISHAGSLTNLSKYPASTIQILGAEKALFRALKTRGKTPKYGLIYNSSFIGKANSKNKGRISRFLANKCSIASRLDNFSDVPTTAFGEALRKQVEERLAFYDTGVQPQPNAKVMTGVLQLLAESKIHEAKADLKRPASDLMDVDKKSKKEKTSKPVSTEEKSQEGSKKDKSEKKEKKEKSKDKFVDGQEEKSETKKEKSKDKKEKSKDSKEEKKKKDKSSN